MIKLHLCVFMVLHVAQFLLVKFTGQNYFTNIWDSDCYCQSLRE